jgi:hypothetical protein
MSDVEYEPDYVDPTDEQYGTRAKALDEPGNALTRAPLIIQEEQ